MIRTSLLLAALCLSFVACKKDHDVGIDPATDSDEPGLETTLEAVAPVLPSTLFSHSTVDVPNHYDGAIVSGQDKTPVDNPITDGGATLGRVLF